MKKFRLIREYPGSPKLNAEITDDNGFVTAIKPQNYPEFWEEIIEKDYEILSFKHKNATTITPVSPSCVEMYLKESSFDIYSVKRL